MTASSPFQSPGASSRTSFALTILSLLVCASVAAAQGTLTVAWDPSPDPNVAGYIVEIVDASGGSLSTYDAQDSTGAVLTGLVPGSTYHVVARAYSQHGQLSEKSGVASGIASIPGVDPPPTAPSGLSAVANTRTPTSAIDMSWGDNAANELGYIIERSYANGDYLGIRQVGADQTTYTDSNLAGDTR